MKILYIITQADGGGAQKYVLALGRHFGGAVAAGSEDEKLFIQAQKTGLEVFPLKHLKRAIHPWHDFLAAWEIRQLIKTYQPDIVHLNSSKAGILGSFAAIGLKTKIIFTAHGFVFNEPLPGWLKAFYLALEKTASSYRDFIITVSNADRKSALDNSLIDVKKISTVHNGISPIEFLSRDEARAALGLTENKFTIGCVANFYKTKGLDIFISAISLLNADTKGKICCVIVGDGLERKFLEQKISRLNLNHIISLPGNSPQVPAAIKAFDLFVLPSRKEGLPYTLLEALQAGLPIITTNVGGNAEAVGEAGILVGPENPKSLAEAITKLAADDNLRKDLSKKSLERSKLFTETKMLGETEKIYRAVLAKN